MMTEEEKEVNSNAWVFSFDIHQSSIELLLIYTERLNLFKSHELHHFW